MAVLATRLHAYVDRTINSSTVVPAKARSSSSSLASKEFARHHHAQASPCAVPTACRLAAALQASICHASSKWRMPQQLTAGGCDREMLSDLAYLLGIGGARSAFEIVIRQNKGGGLAPLAKRRGAARLLIILDYYGFVSSSFCLRIPSAAVQRTIHSDLRKKPPSRFFEGTFYKFCPLKFPTP